MKNVKRILALVLIMIMALSVTGCIHKKNEIAVKIGDVEFTSAYYMCALLEAESAGRTEVSNALTEKGEYSADIDYSKQKIGDKKFETWVKDTAIDKLKEIAAWKLLCKENKIEADKEMIKNAESNVTFYWDYYGYSAYYGSNGVSKETYTEYIKDSVYKETYFEKLYGKDGKKEIAADKVKSTIYENYLIANVLEASYEENSTDAQKALLKTKFEEYAKWLRDGSKTFEEVYLTHNNQTAEDHKHDTESDEPAPKDPHASVLAFDKSLSYASGDYETAKALKVGEVKVIETEDKTGVKLILKQDITADAFYLTELDMDARHTMKDEEFEKEIKNYVKKLDADVSKYATSQFKVDKIVYPQ
ncbi:MAG: hypothetical protein IKT38_03415 [Clostridia bacterium]|nr:hypothetical protein [Clostridia bacterium]